MIVGNPQRFAIDAEPEDPVDGWIFGRFRFWLGATPVGNWDDAADLLGCVKWLEDFTSNPRNRLEPRLEGLSATELIRILYDDYMTLPYQPGVDACDIPDIFSRFHISRLGMSSFDAVDLLLVSTSDGHDRCVTLAMERLANINSSGVRWRPSPRSSAKSSVHYFG
jgi:hypothetical protein